MGDAVEAHFLTMEQGHYSGQQAGRGRRRRGFFAEIHDRIHPLVTSRYVIHNIFNPDLPEELWECDDIARELMDAGRKLDALNLLPAPWPIDDILDERNDAMSNGCSRSAGFPMGISLPGETPIPSG